jgi:hypothetical protein
VSLLILHHEFTAINVIPFNRERIAVSGHADLRTALAIVPKGSKSAETITLPRSPRSAWVPNVALQPTEAETD